MSIELRDPKRDKTVKCADTDFEIWSAKGYTDLISGEVYKAVEDKPKKKKRLKAGTLKN